jgi:hypothetical protein
LRPAQRLSRSTSRTHSASGRRRKSPCLSLAGESR